MVTSRAQILMFALAGPNVWKGQKNGRSGSAGNPLDEVQAVEFDPHAIAVLENHVGKLVVHANLGPRIFLHRLRDGGKQHVSATDGGGQQ